MRGVAGPLEAVEIEGGERVGRRDLVDDEQEPARSRHPGQLGDYELRPGDVMQRPQGAGQVEGRALEIELRRVALDEADVRRRLGPPSLDLLRNELDCDDLAHERRQREGERPRAGACVERALFATHRHELAHPGGELPGASLLERRDPVSRRCEPSPRCVVRTQGPPLSS